VKKTYVQVDSRLSEPQQILPVAIAWPDGRIWNVDRVTHCCVSCDGEFQGVRYTVLIGNQEKYLYREGHQWYVLT